MKWLKQSNRQKHFWIGMLLGVLFTFVGAIAGGIYKEVQDKKGGVFDWLDLAATVLGGLIGSIWPALAIYIVFVQDIYSGLTFYFSVPVFVIGFMCLVEPSTVKEWFLSVKNFVKNIFK